MTEQNTPPDTTSGAAPSTPPAPEVAPLDTGARRAGEPTGYALYDLSELRFVGGVHPTKAKADKGHAKVKGHRYEVREV